MDAPSGLLSATMCATREKSEGRLLPHDGSILLIFFYTDVFPFIDEIGMELQMS